MLVMYFDSKLTILTK